MIIKLGNDIEIALPDIVKDPKAEAIKWLRQYKKSLECDPGSATPIDTERSLCDDKSITD